MPEEKIKKRFSIHKDSVEKSKEMHNKSFYPKENGRKSLSKKKKNQSKNVSRDILQSKQIAKTLKKNHLVDSELTVDLKEKKREKIKSIQKKNSKPETQD